MNSCFEEVCDASGKVISYKGVLIGVPYRSMRVEHMRVTEKSRKIGKVDASS